MHIFSLTSEVFRLQWGRHLTSASHQCIQQRLSQNSFSFHYVETCPLDDHRTIPKITEGGMLKNTFSHLSYWCHFSHISSHLPHWPSPAVLICAPPLLSLWWRQLSTAKEGFTGASLGLLANQRRRHLLTGLLKSLRTIKTLVTSPLLATFLSAGSDLTGWNDPPRGSVRIEQSPWRPCPVEAESSSAAAWF